MVNIESAYAYKQGRLYSNYTYKPHEHCIVSFKAHLQESEDNLEVEMPHIRQSMAHISDSSFVRPSPKNYKQRLEYDDKEDACDADVADDAADDDDVKTDGNDDDADYDDDLMMMMMMKKKKTKKKKKKMMMMMMMMMIMMMIMMMMMMMMNININMFAAILGIDAQVTLLRKT
ncbi:hypothetical protein DPMN_183244 [Dreissena polymorpha]|uniref:Uncharacterized protein n=1 Tax=Dreissena polymorpha TaxID=45954 RepID=A0A9D4DJM6_DREPO|nr:hypothetical protein DPMN_183244 [Dreissena polymorpha]